MKTLLSFLALLSFMAFTMPIPTKNIKKDEGKAKIQVALMLDTSGSMSGLIDQAKSQLWKIVNDLATSKQDGQSPDIEIALYEYGKTTLQKKDGFLRQIANFTTDLDKISEELYALKTNGGDEFCGWVIQDGVQNLDWDTSDKTLKIIFIAGNEAFTQGPKKYQAVCKEAVKSGIIVNTIFCGDHQNGINLKWQDGAYLAEGKYFNINSNAQISHIQTPFDTTIMRLNSALNKTYIGFNQQGSKNKMRLEAQDANAASVSTGVARQRASFKAKKQYNNASWDLVDAYESDIAILDDVEEEALPEDFQNISKEELAQKVTQLTNQRKIILDQIKQAEKQANKFEIEARKNNPEEANTLDKAMIKAIHEQAKQKNFNF